jgi:hypothetical protein
MPVCENSYDTRRRFRVRRINPFDLRMSIGGAQDKCPGCAVRRDVIRITTLTGQQSLIFNAFNRLANTEFYHEVPPGQSVADASSHYRNLQMLGI